MAAPSPSRAGVYAEPNVIPMIDIMLVLLIVFIVISLRIRPVLDLQLPAPEPAAGAPRVQIVLELPAGGGFRLNGQPVPDERLDATLHALYAERSAKLLFVKAAGSRSYQEVVTAMDRARGTGVAVIGLMPR